MILIIMRHGEAVPYQANDKSRTLTRFGSAQSTTAGKRLAAFFKQSSLPSHIDKVLVSPYIRTQQTYDAVATSVSFGAKTDTDLITPMGDAVGVHDLIDGFADDEDAPEHLMLISHMPLVSLLADKVCSGFNGKIFDTADILIIDYNTQTHTGEQVALYQSMNERV